MKSRKKPCGIYPLDSTNPVLTRIDNSRRIHMAITLIAVPIVLFLGALTFFGINVLFRKIGIGMQSVFLSLLPFVFMVFWVWVYIRLVEKRKFITLGFYPHRALRNYASGLLLGLLLTTISIIVISLLSPTQIELNPTIDRRDIAVILSVLFFFTIQGAAEEVVIRGWALISMAKRHNIWLALISSSLIFSLIHCFNNNFGILPAVNILLIGLNLAILVFRHGSIWSACGLHTAWNFSLNSIWGNNVSGSGIMGNSIISSTLKGNKLLTGGDFGIEGSIVVTGIFLLLLILLLLPKRQQAPAIA